MTLPPMFGAVNTAIVDVAAPVEAVWQVLFERSRWVPDFAGKEALDGPTDAVGERALFSTHTPNGGTATRIEEILVSVPHRRLVTRLALAEGDATFAFAEWRLSPAGDGSALEMNLYWIDLPEAGADWPAIQAQRQDYLGVTQAALDGLVAGIAAAASAGPATR